MSATTDLLLDTQEQDRQTRFEKFLEMKCFKENPQVLDDDMPDFFNNWLAGLDAEQLIEYGNEAMSKL